MSWDKPSSGGDSHPDRPPRDPRDRPFPRDDAWPATGWEAVEKDKDEQQPAADLESDKARLTAENKALRAEVAALRTELTDLRAAGKQREWKDRAQDTQLTELKDQVREVSHRLEALGESPKPSARIDSRTDDEPGREAEREEGRPRRHLPSDAALNFGATVAGAGAAATAAGYIPHVSSDAAGIGAAVAAAGVGGLAWIRDRRSRKAEKDADHRPEG